MIDKDQIVADGYVAWGVENRFIEGLFVKNNLIDLQIIKNNNINDKNKPLAIPHKDIIPRSFHLKQNSPTISGIREPLTIIDLVVISVEDS